MRDRQHVFQCKSPQFGVAETRDERREIGVSREGPKWRSNWRRQHFAIIRCALSFALKPQLELCSLCLSVEKATGSRLVSSVADICLLLHTTRNRIDNSNNSNTDNRFKAIKEAEAEAEEEELRLEVSELLRAPLLCHRAVLLLAQASGMLVARLSPNNRIHRDFIVNTDTGQRKASSGYNCRGSSNNEPKHRGQQ